jgi:hypothetical protein
VRSAHLPSAETTEGHLPPRMRILFLVSRDICHPANTGGDIYLWEQALYLASEGHDVVLMASTFPGAPPRETINGIRVVRLGGLLSLWWRTFIYYMTECRGKYDVIVVEGFGGSRIPRLTPVYVKEPIVTEWHQIHAALFAAQYPGPLVPLLNLLERVRMHFQASVSNSNTSASCRSASRTTG